LVGEFFRKLSTARLSAVYFAFSNTSRYLGNLSAYTEPSQTFSGLPEARKTLPIA